MKNQHTLIRTCPTCENTFVTENENQVECDGCEQKMKCECCQEKYMQDDMHFIVTDVWDDEKEGYYVCPDCDGDEPLPIYNPYTIGVL